MLLNKPIYIGAAVLDLSKLVMYNFWHEFIKKKYESKGIKFNLLYKDTDSFIIEVIGGDFDNIMLEFKDYFDLSNYPKGSIYYNNENKKVPGKMKNEYPTRYIHEYIGLKPKSYSLFIIYYLKIK